MLAYPGFGKPHRDGADLVRERAAGALANLKDYNSDIIQALKYATDDAFQNVRQAATEALQQLERLQSKSILPSSVQGLRSSGQKRLNFLKERLAGEARVLQNEFKKTRPNYNLIKKSFYLFSWRVTELNWGYKYSIKKIVPEEAWHLFEFICRYLTSQLNIDFIAWSGIADECRSLSSIINSKENEPKKIEYPCLQTIVRPKFGETHLRLIADQVTKFLESPGQFKPDNSIDCYALLGLLTVVGESAKRLDGINPGLPKNLKDELNIIEKIRNLLEKKSSSNLFDSPKLIEKIYGELTLLKKAIEDYLQKPPVITDIQKSDTFKQLLELLEESSYKESERIKIFFASLETQQNQLLQLLENADYSSFLIVRFKVDRNDTDEIIKELKNSQVQNLSQKEKDQLITLAKEHLSTNPLLNALLKQINNSRTKPNGIKQFLKQKKIEVEAIDNILNNKSTTSNTYITKVLKQNVLTKETIGHVGKLFETLRKNQSAENFDSILFGKIKQLPWLLNLTNKQVKFLEVLNCDEAVDNKASLDALLQDNRLNEDKINSILSSITSPRLYEPKKYYKKFKYPNTTIDEIKRLAKVIDNLIKLLVDIKEEDKDKKTSFAKLIKENYSYQLALQTAIKAFAIIVKEKLGKEAKQYLLANNADDLSVKHIKLLELFRDKLAHCAAEVDPYQLSWFALQWAIISYPAVKKKVSTKLAQPINTRTADRLEEYAISESTLTEHVVLILDLIKAHGFKKARVFGCSLGCNLGVQAELNIIVDSVPEMPDLYLNIYDLQWRIYFLLGYKVKIFTEQELENNLSKTTSKTQIKKIIAKAVDLVTLQHLARIKEFVDSKNWHHLLLCDKNKFAYKKDVDFSNIDYKKVKTIILASQSKYFLRQRNFRIKLLEQESVKKIILDKATFYVNSLLEVINTVNSSVKSLFLERLKTTMLLNFELDGFYEKHVGLISSHDFQISRFSFRDLMRSKHEKLPKEIQSSELAKQAKQDWDNEGYITAEIDKKNGESCVFLLTRLYFLLGEVYNPGVVELLFSNDTHNNYDLKSQLLGCVYSDFCKRFIDPYEEDYTIFFIKSVGWIETDQSIRIPFYAEVLRKMSNHELPLPIIDWGIEVRIRKKILNIHHGNKPLPEKKMMTTSNLFMLSKDLVYKGKIPKLTCQAATFEYPPITDFDSLLKKEQVDKRNYPEYKKDKTQFNQFQKVIGYLYKIFYYEKYIRNLEQYKSKIESDSSTLVHDSNAFKVSVEYIQEISAQIELLRNSEKQHIKELLSCQYLKSHFSAKDSNFSKRLFREVVDWVYHDVSANSSGSKLHRLFHDCFSHTSSETSFFSSSSTSTNRPHGLPDLEDFSSATSELTRANGEGEQLTIEDSPD